MILSYIVDDLLKYPIVRNVLKNRFNMSNRLITKLKNNKLIFLNNKTTYLDAKLSMGDIISCSLDICEESENIIPIKMDLDINYEDDCLIVINKPPHIAVHPSISHYENSLSNGVKYYFNSIGLKKKIRPVNRLDRDTTGLVIFAKNEYIQESLIRQMMLNKFYKEYIAILDGIVNPDKGIIDAPIGRKESSIIERCINENGSPAITNYEIVSLFNNMSLVKFVLKTGRTHQIRVHSQFIGHSIIGDTLYGNSSSLINRQALHCYRLIFNHPIKNKKIELVAPIPDDFQNILNKNV